MADFNNLKGAVLSTLGNVAGKTRDFAEKAADKAKDVTKLAKLNLELNSAKEALEKTYAEIGRLYYDTRKNDPDSFFVQLCEEVTISNENIARLQIELDELKAGVDTKKDEDIVVEITEEDAPAEEAKTEQPSEETTSEQPAE
ncbi:MAG: hypothetical protein ACI3UZ_03965 [Oscillospiraceae bacterium]